MSDQSDTPETDALVARWADMAKQPADLTFTQLHDLIEQVVKEILKSHEDLERRLALAQTRIAELEKALSRIAKWFGEFPVTGDSWADGTPVSYGAAFGSNGERDYMRSIASAALKSRP